MNRQSLKVAPGDVIAQQEGSSWHVIKILQVDSFPDGTSTAHCLSYNDSKSKPSATSIATLGVRIWHAPILASSFAGWERISNQTVTKEELAGFIEYLKHTNFARYITFTGQDLKAVIRRANEHFQRAYRLGEQGRRTEAIAEYTQAIDLVPRFYEAIDNRAFTYMDLGRYKDALEDFERSLDVNPNGFEAFFSKGECLLRLGEFSQAEAIFEEGLTRFPEQRTTFEKFRQIARAKRMGS